MTVNVSPYGKLSVPSSVRLVSAGTHFGASLAGSFSRLLKNGLERNSASFLFLLPEAEVHLVQAPT
jgi:hypothetical protein